MFFKIKIYGKSNLYGRLLLFVILVSFTFVISSESKFLYDHPVVGPKIGGTIVSILLLGFFLYAIELIVLMGGYGINVKRWLYFYSFFNIVGAIYIANPFVDILSFESKQILYSFFHLLNLTWFIVFSIFILKDIFSSEKTHSDHIWGAIVLYFLLIFIFSEFYELVSLQIPGMLGEEYEIGWPNYIQCYVFSLNSISGMDLVYSNAHSLFKKIAIIENVIGNLFLVVILGRLLSHPLEKKSL